MAKPTALIIFLFAVLSAYSQNDKNQAFVPESGRSFTVSFRLYPTQNMWNFIKLNTRTGQMWQVQFDVQGDNRMTTELSSMALTSRDEEFNDRFTLYPTQNIYTFLLIDQFDGRTWQAHWSIDAKKRGIIPIP